MTSFEDQLNGLKYPSPKNQQIYEERTGNVQTEPHSSHGHMVNHWPGM